MSVNINSLHPMSLPSSTRVLVVGAGPAGMTCALSLWHSGIKDVTIVEASGQGNGNTSRAMVIHAATLEELDYVHCADALIERGIKVSEMNYYDREDTLLMSADFDGLIGKTRFPFYLLLPQNITEDALIKKLNEVGIPLFRSHKVVGMRENANDCHAVDVSFENGRSITAQYVVGADGPQSTVRQLSGIKFVDPFCPDEPEDLNSLAQIVIADITFDIEPEVPGKFYAVISTESFFILSHLQYPMEGSKDAGGKITHRMVCGVPFSRGTPPSKASAEYCQDLIESYGPRSLSSDKNKNPKAMKIDNVVWSTRFRTRYAAAEQFFTYFGRDKDQARPTGARVCLIGDAAHIHPPAGGQGMNLGLRDAVSLGPVIAAALTAGSTPETDEKVRELMALRRERAVNVIGITKYMAGAVGLSPSLRSKFEWSPIHIYTIRDWVVWMLGKSKWVQQSLAFKFSGLAER